MPAKQPLTARVASAVARGFVRWIPEAFTITLLLTTLTLGLAVVLAGFPPRSAIEAWGNGFWSLLEFTNQITLTLLLGYALANTPPVRRALISAAGLVSTPRGAYVLACVITGLCSLISWGLGLVTAGIIARAIGESCHSKGVRGHFPLLVASAFSGFVIWHQGLTSSIGLALATPGSFLEDSVGLIATSETLFTAWNAALAVFVLGTLPFVMAALAPSEPDGIEPIPEWLCSDGPELAKPEEEWTPARGLESSWLPTAAIVIAGAVFVALELFPLDRFLELDRINFVFLLLGMIFCASPARFIGIIADGGRIAAPVLVLYPFYAGIKGLMADSGLARMLVEFFVSVSSPSTLPVFGFLSGGLVNLFIPSGGGQWAVQGPIMMAAAQEIGADLPRVAMAVALGDQWTNLIQPLVIVPVLLISGTAVRQVAGYMLAAVAWTGLVFVLALTLF